MVGATFGHFQLKCQHCETVNVLGVISAKNIPGKTILCCSKCKSPIGLWRDLQEIQAAKRGFPEPHTHSIANKQA